MMKSKHMLIVAILVLLVAVGIIAVMLKRGSTTVVPVDDIATLPEGVWPSDELRKEVIDQDTGGYTITATYPIAQSSAVSAYFRTFVDDAITAFKEDTAWSTEIQNEESENLALDIGYDRIKSSVIDNYVFHISSYTGGAHGLQATKTFSFSTKGQPLGIAELFTNGVDGLKTIAPYVQKELLKLDYTEKSWVEEGAAPTEINYQNFIVDEKGLTVIFDPYQVAYYAAGEQRVTVPLSVFSKIANKEVFIQ